MLVDIQPYQMAQGIVSQIRPVTVKSVTIIGIKGKAIHQKRTDRPGYNTTYIVDGKEFDSSKFFDPVGPMLDIVEDFSAQEVWIGRKLLETVPSEKAFFGFSIATGMKISDVDLPKIVMEVSQLLAEHSIYSTMRIASVLTGSVAE